MSKQQTKPLICTRCALHCKIDAVPAPYFIGVIRKYIPTIANEAITEYTANNKTKQVPLLDSKSKAIQYGQKIAKSCEIPSKTR